MEDDWQSKLPRMVKHPLYPPHGCKFCTYFATLSLLDLILQILVPLHLFQNLYANLSGTYELNIRSLLDHGHHTFQQRH